MDVCVRVHAYVCVCVCVCVCVPVCVCAVILPPYSPRGLCISISLCKVEESLCIFVYFVYLCVFCSYNWETAI